MPAWTRFRLHLGAARREPVRYLIAAWWWLLRKRVRARGQFARLLAGSPLAYLQWIANSEAHEPPPPPDAEQVTIVALIDVPPGATRPRALERLVHDLATQEIAALVIRQEQPSSLAEASELIDWSASPWLMPVSSGDVLAPGAAARYRQAAAETEASIIYADDDLLDRRGHRTAPHFKPDWNAELFRHFDYLTGACIVRGRSEEVTGVADRDWAVRLVAAAIGHRGTPVHIHHVLHHRGTRLTPKVPATVRVITAELPPVTVIVPTRNRVDLLRTCLAGLDRTRYPDFDVIVVDNDSDDPATLTYLNSLASPRYRVLRYPGPFNFSSMNNRAAERATGRLLCLLNNDIDVVEPTWLGVMAMQAIRPGVGAVGARLLYADGRIQHAGVVLGIGGGAAHAHRRLHPDEQGYFRRHALPQFVSAVTAACLMVRRECFDAVGGFDETHFAVAFNDVDLCMRLNERGWQSLYEPRATLIHHESVTRGYDRDPVGALRLKGELAALQARWRTDERIDPYHHPELNRHSERFTVRL